MLLATLMAAACSDKWDERLSNSDETSRVDLATRIASETSLSRFNTFLQITAYDKVLASAQSYTVWAPDNDALAQLNIADTDTARILEIVQNHMALSAIKELKTDTLRVQLLNKKYATVTANLFEEANAIGKPVFVKNGVLQIVDRALDPKKNIWEYLQSLTDAAFQKNYLNSLTTNVIDSANAKIIGYTAAGQPKYALDAPTVARNTYWSNVANINAEGNAYTFFVLRDAAYTYEVNKLVPYYADASQGQLLNDLAVKGIYTLDKIPDTLLSVRGVKIPVNKAAIVNSYKASNGIVYVVDELPFRIIDKVSQFKVEGENPVSFRLSTKSSTIQYRTKVDSAGKTYKDIQIYGHRTAEFYAVYRTAPVAKGRYKVFARAISGGLGDPVTAAYTQRYFIADNTGAFPSTATFTHLVNPRTQTEVELGVFENLAFGPIQFQLKSANSTTDSANPLILDYLRFEPILP